MNAFGPPDFGYLNDVAGMLGFGLRQSREASLGDQQLFLVLVGETLDRREMTKHLADSARIEEDAVMSEWLELFPDAADEARGSEIFIHDRLLGACGRQTPAG